MKLVGELVPRDPKKTLSGISSLNLEKSYSTLSNENA